MVATKEIVDPLNFAELASAGVAVRVGTDPAARGYDPLERYRSVPNHALFLYTDEDESLVKFVREHWAALDGLSGGSCDIYPSLVQLCGGADAYSQLDEIKSLPGLSALQLSVLPVLHVWSAHAHMTVLLDNFRNHNDLSRAFRFIFWELRCLHGPLDSVSALRIAAAFVQALVPSAVSTLENSGHRTVKAPEIVKMESNQVSSEHSGHQYDVCLSFASEDREYVELVANCLRVCGVRVFYDKYEEVNLWGKDLYVHLDRVYRELSRYCVTFLSVHYARKLWANHERESAQARAFSENSEYVLPAKFDDTSIPGIRPTVGFIDLRSKTPDEFAAMLCVKLGVANMGPAEYPKVELKVGTTWSNLANEEVSFSIVMFRARRVGASNFSDMNGATTQTLYQQPEGGYRVHVQHNFRGDYGVWSLVGGNEEDRTGEGPPMTLSQLQDRFPGLASQCGLPRVRSL